MGIAIANPIAMEFSLPWFTEIGILEISIIRKK